ncbi:MAG: cation diffusion facilitator family transporter [Candidatus Cloacimonadales bacterium]|nr:cation diffusion facilitator family transporter [Candidatus Cloacimonadales bacterium]
MLNKKTRIGYFQAIMSIILNLLLFALKIYAGIRSASIAIIADAWHTLSDSFSSLILLFGFKIAAKPADEKHPFGHGRAEVIATVIVGTVLAIIGFSFLVESIKRLQEQQAANFGTLAYAATIISILSKEGMAQFAIRSGKKHDSFLLIADGWHHRSDAISSVVVLIGILLGKIVWWADGVMGIIMAFLLFYASYDILKHSVSPLIGEEPDEELTNSIIDFIKRNIDQPVNMHHLHVHKYGDHKEVTFHIELDPDMQLRAAHQIADEIERLLRSEMCLEATIHLEPIRK